MSYFLSSMILRVVRFLWEAPSDDAPRYREETANSDGLPVHIDYGDLQVFSPDQNYRVTWTYRSEPPFGDSVNQVSLDGKSFPGYYWGRGHVWSPNSDYFTLERWLKGSGALYVVRVADFTWMKVADRSSPLKFVYPLLIHRFYDESNAQQHFDFLRSQSWTPIQDDQPFE